MRMSITKSAYTPTHKRPSGLYLFAQSALNAVAFDLLNWEGSRERIVSAWKQISAGVLKVGPDGECDESAQLYDAVENDVGEEAAQHEFGGDFDYELNEWYQAFADVANSYGFYGWPTLALTDYLREFEGYDQSRAKATAERVWETALMLYDARKSAEKKPAEKPKKKAA